MLHTDNDWWPLFFGEMFLFFCEMFFSNMLGFNQVLLLFHNIRQTRKEINDHTSPNEDNIVFPFQPTSSLVAAIHDLQLFEGLTSASAPVLGYSRVSPMDLEPSKTRKTGLDHFFLVHQNRLVEFKTNQNLRNFGTRTRSLTVRARK
jgi:hypothetical protein